jgi:hypothetical protein
MKAIGQKLGIDINVSGSRWRWVRTATGHGAITMISPRRNSVHDAIHKIGPLNGPTVETSIFGDGAVDQGTLKNRSTIIMTRRIFFVRTIDRRAMSRSSARVSNRKIGGDPTVGEVTAIGPTAGAGNHLIPGQGTMAQSHLAGTSTSRRSGIGDDPAIVNHRLG